MSKLIRLFEQPWAITEQVLDALMDVVLRNDVERLKTLSNKEQAEDKSYRIEDGIAVIPIFGTLYSRSYFFNCGTTYSEISERLKQALADEDVQAILFHVDSPGGAVAGLFDLADEIYRAREIKPIFGFTDSQATSAAYCLLCATQKSAASPLAQIGSIGVITLHVDRSKMDEKEGIKRTYLTAGKYKAVGNDAEPLDEQAKNYIQERLDNIYSYFVNKVAEYRGVDVEQVLSFAEGKVFLANNGHKKGMVDLVLTKSDFLKHIKKELNMDLQELKTKHGDLVEAIKNEALVEAGEKIRAEVVELAQAIDPNFAQKLSALLSAGVNAKQVKELQKVFAVAQAQEEKNDKHGEILEAIYNAHPEGVSEITAENSQDNFLLKAVKSRLKNR